MPLWQVERTLFLLGLSISKDNQNNSGPLFKYLTNLMVKFFVNMLTRNFPHCNVSPGSSSTVHLRIVWLQLFSFQFLWTAIDFPFSFLFRMKKLFSQPVYSVISSSPRPSGQPSAGLVPVYQCLSSDGKPQTEHATTAISQVQSRGKQ